MIFLFMNVKLERYVINCIDINIHHLYSSYSCITNICNFFFLGVFTRQKIKDKEKEKLTIKQYKNRFRMNT